MGESIDMTKKYQEHYNQILSGTLSESIIKSISYQANIKLANDVIAENEETIKNLNEEIDKLKAELESIKSNKAISDNQKISILEKNVRDHIDNITRLTNTINELNRYKNEYESIKTQVQHVDTFRNELDKSRQQLKDLQVEHGKKIDELVKQHNEKIEELNKRIEYLQLTPAKRKKIDAESVKVIEEKPTETVTKAKIIKQDVPAVVIKRDGGAF